MESPDLARVGEGGPVLPFPAADGQRPRSPQHAGLRAAAATFFEGRCAAALHPAGAVVRPGKNDREQGKEAHDHGDGGDDVFRHAGDSFASKNATEPCAMPAAASLIQIKSGQLVAGGYFTAPMVRPRTM